MRKLSILAILLLSTSAYAADIPIKAKSNFLAAYTQGQCGGYFGLNAFGSAASVQGGVVGAQIVQGDIGATFGYGCPIGGTVGNFWFTEASFDWANINGASNGFGFTGPAHFEQRFALGSPLSSILNLLPTNPFSSLSTPAVPLCPTNVTCGNQYPFLFVTSHEQSISGQVGLSGNKEWIWYPGVGIGLESRWSNGVVADVWAQFTLNSTGMTIGPQKVNIGNGATTGITFKY